MCAEAIIASLEQVSYQYPHTAIFALNNLSLDIQEGEFVGLVGPTGAGKTTFCLALNGIVPQFFGGRFFGRITVADLDTLDHPTSILARHVAEVFENPETQLITTSVENEVAFALENFGLPPAEIHTRIHSALYAVRLGGYEKKRPADLSGGQKQRLAIAAALAIQPRLLVLDEPTSQLDPLGVEEVFETLSTLNHEHGVTVVMASHAVEELAEYASRIALLNHGQVIAAGAPSEIFNRLDLLAQAGLHPPQVTRAFSLAGAASPLPILLSEARQQLPRLRRKSSSCPSGSQVSPPKGEALLSIQDLDFSYPDGTQALRGVSLDISAGEYVLIAGQNGAGKTTLVKNFLGLLKPSGGRILLEGQDTAHLQTGQLAQRMGYVGQNPDQQLFCTTAAEEVGYALKNLGRPAAEIRPRVDHSLAEMGLEEARNRHPLSLPRGDRARLVIAAVLALQPEILILDEPTTGQDPQGAARILEITRRLHQSGKTVIVITHHLHLLPGYAERMVVMGQGKILLDAPLRQAFHQVDLLRSTYLNPPQVTLLTQGLDTPLLTPEEFGACYEVRA